jgi:hypothetical protein
MMSAPADIATHQQCPPSYVGGNNSDGNVVPTTLVSRLTKVAEVHTRYVAPTETPTEHERRVMSVAAQHLCKFLEPDADGNLEVWDLKNQQCNCVRPDEEFYMCSCGSGVKIADLSVVTLRARACLTQTLDIPHNLITDNYKYHRVTPAEMNAVRKCWEVDKGYVTAWVFSVTPLDEPMRAPYAFGQRGWFWIDSSKMQPIRTFSHPGSSQATIRTTPSNICAFFTSSVVDVPDALPHHPLVRNSEPSGDQCVYHVSPGC